MADADWLMESSLASSSAETCTSSSARFPAAVRVRLHGRPPLTVLQQWPSVSIAEGCSSSPLAATDVPAVIGLLFSTASWQHRCESPPMGQKAGPV